MFNKLCLNPFGTGQYLTTQDETAGHWETESQSLWNRAMSYDLASLFNEEAVAGLNPFGTGQCLTTKGQRKARIAKSQSLWNRAMSYDRSGVLKPCSTRLARATSQLFPRLR